MKLHLCKWYYVFADDATAPGKTWKKENKTSRPTAVKLEAVRRRFFIKIWGVSHIPHPTTSERWIIFALPWYHPSANLMRQKKWEKIVPSAFWSAISFRRSVILVGGGKLKKCNCPWDFDSLDIDDEKYLTGFYKKKRKVSVSSLDNYLMRWRLIMVNIEPSLNWIELNCF